MARSLGIQPLEKDINSLHVCYEHFKDSDYSCCPTSRRLINDAIPSIILPENIRNASTNSNISQHDERLIQLENNIMQVQHDMQQQQQLHKTQLEDNIIQVQNEMEQLKTIVVQQLTPVKSCTRPDLKEITRQTLLTPKASRLYKQNVELKRDKRRLLRRIKEMKNKKSYEKNNTISAAIDDQFVGMITRNKVVAPQARCYTAEEKMFCTAIFRRSRAAYNLLSHYIPCPSATTLQNYLRNIVVTPGCNSTVMKYLKLVAKEVSNNDLYCILIWDEMSIHPSVLYDFKPDNIRGFEEWGMRRTRKFADHAIVFYMKCLSSGNHMPLGYGFCENSTNTPQLARCIKQWLAVLIYCGFKPLATVCDQVLLKISIHSILLFSNHHVEDISNNCND